MIGRMLCALRDQRGGGWIDTLVVMVVLVLGGTAVLYGILNAQRHLGGQEVKAIRCVDPANPDPNCVP